MQVALCTVFTTYLLPYLPSSSSSQSNHPRPTNKWCESFGSQLAVLVRADDSTVHKAYQNIRHEPLAVVDCEIEGSARRRGLALLIKQLQSERQLGGDLNAATQCTAALQGDVSLHLIALHRRFGFQPLGNILNDESTYRHARAKPAARRLSRVEHCANGGIVGIDEKADRN